MQMSDEQAAKILTVGQAVDFVLAHAPADRERRPDRCEPSRHSSTSCRRTSRRQVFTHASWTERRCDSYSRLAFLGDSVLALAVTAHLYPRLEAERFGAGRLTKIRAQAVSGRRAARSPSGSACRSGCGRRAGGRRAERRRAGRDRARARVGDRGGDRRLLPARRLRAHGGGGRRGVPAGDRAGARAPGRLQVGAAGAARPARRARSPTTVDGRGRPAARPHLRGRGVGRRARASGAARGRRRSTPSRRPRGPRSRRRSGDEDDDVGGA